MRLDKRTGAQLRPVEILPGFTRMAAGSALINWGETRVLCTASFQPGVPAFLKGRGQGWLTAEYAMLPGDLVEALPAILKENQMEHP